MKVLVTGHQGYIGAVTVRTLLEAGHGVTGTDTGYFPAASGPVDRPDVHAIRKDVRDLDSRDLAGLDAVVHLAALSNDPIGELDPALTDEINFRASVRLAQLAADAGASRFVFSSSCSIYGAAGSDAELDERAPLAPVTAYAVSKVRAEEALAKLARKGFSPVYMRNATAYGVSPMLRLDLVLNNLAARAYTTGTVKVLGDGTPWRPLVHVEDIAAAFLAALEAPVEAIHDQAFNVGKSGENYRVREVAETVADAVPGSRVEIAGTSGPDRRSYRVSFAKIARTLPAFHPQWDIRTGAAQLYTVYSQVKLTESDVEDRKYIRLRQIRYLMDRGLVDASLRWKRDG